MGENLHWNGRALRPSQPLEAAALFVPSLPSQELLSDHLPAFRCSHNHHAPPLALVLSRCVQHGTRSLRERRDAGLWVISLLRGRQPSPGQAGIHNKKLQKSSYLHSPQMKRVLSRHKAPRSNWNIWKDPSSVTWWAEHCSVSSMCAQPSLLEKSFHKRFVDYLED